MVPPAEPSPANDGVSLTGPRRTAPTHLLVLAHSALIRPHVPPPTPTPQPPLTHRDTHQTSHPLGHKGSTHLQHIFQLPPSVRPSSPLICLALLSEQRCPSPPPGWEGTVCPQSCTQLWDEQEQRNGTVAAARSQSWEPHYVICKTDANSAHIHVVKAPTGAVQPMAYYTWETYGRFILDLEWLRVFAVQGEWTDACQLWPHSSSPRGFPLISALAQPVTVIHVSMDLCFIGDDDTWMCFDLWYSVRCCHAISYLDLGADIRSDVIKIRTEFRKC